MATHCCSRGSPILRSFIQTAIRGFSSVAGSAPGPLEFLVPRGIYTASAIRTTRATTRHGSGTSLGPSSGALWRRLNARGFSVSARYHATRYALNPRKDEDGNEMLLEITPRAAQRLSEIMKKDNNPNLALRIQVESGGCHGFQYLMSLVTIPREDAQEPTSIVDEEDSILQFYPDDATSDANNQEGPRIILDEPSLSLLKGSKVDFTRELIGSQFKIVDNPYATSSCGCGTSFDIKM